MAQNAVWVRRAGERGDAPAHSGGAGGASLCAVPGALSHPSGPGCSPRTGGAGSLAGAGVLPPRPAAARGCQGGGVPAPRPGAAQRGSAPAAAWRGALHRRCCGLHCAWRVRTHCGRKRVPGAGAADSPQRTARRQGSAGVGVGTGHPAGAGCAKPRRHQRSAHGTGRHRLHAWSAAVPCVPAARWLQGRCCGRPHALASAQARCSAAGCALARRGVRAPRFSGAGAARQHWPVGAHVAAASAGIGRRRIRHGCSRRCLVGRTRAGARGV